MELSAARQDRAAPPRDPAAPPGGSVSRVSRALRHHGGPAPSPWVRSLAEGEAGGGAEARGLAFPARGRRGCAGPGEPRWAGGVAYGVALGGGERHAPTGPHQLPVATGHSRSPISAVTKQRTVLKLYINGSENESRVIRSNPPAALAKCSLPAALVPSHVEAAKWEFL